MKEAFIEASQGERQKLWDEMGRIEGVWTAAGAKLIGSWTGSMDVDGFDYYDLYEVPNVGVVHQYRDEWFEADTRKYVEGEFLIGWAPSWDPAVR